VSLTRRDATLARRATLARGASLAELVAALTVSAVLALLAGRILATAACHLRSRSERIGLEHSLRVAAGGLRAALEPLGADSVGGSDVLSMAPDRVVVRAVRGAGAACAVTPDAVIARLGPGWWTALRAPEPGRDSLLMDTVAEPPRWYALSLAAPPRAGRCPDGSAGLVLPVVVPDGWIGALGAGSPIRVFEDLEVRLYASAASAWLGLRSLGAGEAIQPLAGPFAPGGVLLEFAARDGAPATAPADIVSTRVSLSGLTERAGGVGVVRGEPGRPDSVTFTVTRRGPP